MLFEAAGIPRVAISPSIQELSSKVSYPLGAGGTGTTLMMVPGCTRNGHKKIAAIHFDTPQMAPLFAALEPMLKAYGAELVATIPVPAGTTDFQQFTLAAEKAGATCAIIPLGTSEAVQVLQAAQQLGSKMTFSASFGSFGTADLEAFGDFAKQIYLNAEIPPITADQQTWPILKEAIADLSASGDPELQRDRVKSSTFASWIAIYASSRSSRTSARRTPSRREAVSAAVQEGQGRRHVRTDPAVDAERERRRTGARSRRSRNPGTTWRRSTDGKFNIQPSSTTSSLSSAARSTTRSRVRRPHRRPAPAGPTTTGG